MRIKRLTFKNHPILENLDLDFTINGKIVNTIIIAGENGCGKTSLLNNMFQALSMLEYHNFIKTQGWIEHFSVKVELELSLSEIDKINSFVSEKNRYLYNEIGLVTGVKTLLIHNYDTDISSNNIEVEVMTNAGNKRVKGASNESFLLNSLAKRLFVDSDVNFTVESISKVTSMSLDEIKSVKVRSTPRLASEISQLFVDIQHIDSSELSLWVKHNPGQAPPEEMVDVRMKRFTKAFDYMFPSKKFKGIETSQNVKKIMFTENGRDMNISDLSSGEKQIVFRAGFLLRDVNFSDGGLVFIDEPEISLHPNWQLKILSFYKQLFTQNGQQKNQLFISTHSPFLIHNASRTDDKVIILRKDSEGKIITEKEPTFFGWSREVKIEKAFNINHLIKPRCINVFVEGETDEIYYNKAMEVYKMDTTKISIVWIGKNGSKGPYNTGNKALDNAKIFFESNPAMLTGKVVLLYDSDTKRSPENFGDLSIRCMKLNSENSTYKKGVENLLSLPKEMDLNQFNKTKEEITDMNEKRIIQSLDKMKLCKYVCNDLKDSERDVALKLVKDQIAEIIEELD